MDSCIIISDGEEEDDSINPIQDVSVQVIAEIKHDVIDLTDGGANKTLSNETLPKLDEVKLKSNEALQSDVSHQSDDDAQLEFDKSEPESHSLNLREESPLNLCGSESESDDGNLDLGDPEPKSNKRVRARPRSDSNSKESQSKSNKTQLKLDRARLKEQKQQEKELERVRKEANRVNTASKATQNCTAIVDREILKLIEDPEEANFKTLFEESSLNYKITSFPKYDNCVTWEFKRAEVDNNSCVVTTKDTDLILRIMDGAEYAKRISLYKDDPNNPEALNNFIRELRHKSQASIVIIVYKLSIYLRNERQKEAKSYQKKFKDRFESGGALNDKNDLDDKCNTNLSDLEELRLTLQIDIEHNNPDWKVHIEFREKTVEVVSSIVRYTKSTAGREIKKKEKAITMLDWAINMDKEKAIDPTKSSEDLTKLWIAQLQQFSQITLPIAKTIAAEYPSPSALIDQYQSLTHDEAQDLLAGLHVQRNLKRQVGQSISRRIYRFLTSSDPDIHIGFD